jgi:hypothetical protein
MFKLPSTSFEQFLSQIVGATHQGIIGSILVCFREVITLAGRKRKLLSAASVASLHPTQCFGMWRKHTGPVDAANETGRTYINLQNYYATSIFLYTRVTITMWTPVFACSRHHDPTTAIVTSFIAVVLSI